MAAPAKSTAIYNPDEDETLAQILELNQAICDHLKEDDPFKVMPFMITTHKFVKNKPLGFHIKLVPSFMLTNYWRLNKYPDKEYPTHFVAIQSVAPLSQASSKFLEPGYILVRVNGVDVWKVPREEAIAATLSAARTKGDGQLTVTFAREMDSFLGEQIQERRRRPTLYEDCTTKVYPPNMNLTPRLIPMRAYELQDCMLCLDDETGLPGEVSELKVTKTGNGHAVFTYKLRMPHSGRTSSAMHSGGDRLLFPVMKNMEYLVSHMDGDDDLVCLTRDYNEIFLKLSPKREEVHANVAATIRSNRNKDIYVTVLEGPMKVNDTIEILQIVTEVSRVVDS